MKKIVRAFTSLLVLMLLTLSVCPKIYAKEADFSSEYYNESNIFATIGYYGQCTWYAYGRAAEVNKTSYPFKWDAAKWYSYALSSGEFEVGQEPKTNSIAVWAINSYGHVAYVESVDGDMVTFSEANNDHAIDYKSYKLSTGINQYDGLKTFSSSKMKTRYSKGYLLGYIYLSKEDSEMVEELEELCESPDETEASVNVSETPLEKETVVIYSNNDYYCAKSLIHSEIINDGKGLIIDGNNLPIIE